MFDALCICQERRHLYSIICFQALAEEQIERFRQHLYCPECHGRAYYRKASRDGRSACFGSRYHTEGCSLAQSSPGQELEQRDAAEVAQMLTEEVIPFSFNPGKQGERSRATTVGAAREGLRPARAGTPRPLTLAKALHSLMRGSDLADSDTLIELDQGYRFKASNLFVNFADARAAESAKEARPKMFWGTLSHADGDLDWLNPAECTDVGIPIRRHRRTILTRYGIEDREALAGAGIMLFGKCYWNQARTRKIIEPWNAERIHLSLADA
ncbi:hypothetical protein FCL40_04615 [Ferrimonas sediminicola]|uniref:Uncharacterized protein n=1 Tax=Ferrimonas sediminicola TaxID=2569538 RepID=A0A4U1BGI5_9GAMM|nr:hypothetical protein [Ferrimonas sediminicola]TKB50442.1 hypothetical protein FCL40_04615 [Ferrimonas sediminicola]